MIRYTPVAETDADKRYETAAIESGILAVLDKKSKRQKLPQKTVLTMVCECDNIEKVGGSNAATYEKRDRIFHSNSNTNVTHLLRDR
jgi:hypothetical protein